MSSVSQHRQYLTPADMDMIMRVHARVSARNAIMAGSLDAERLAALLVRTFQHGVSEETGLLAAFMADGASRPGIPASRMNRLIGRALNEWEAGSETVSH